MVRNLANLSRHTYDVLVIGGGIYGVCIAWDAALRGLSVALIDKGDFGHATSSNSLRVIHGGLRYLQHGNMRRVRRSIQERAAFMRVAPHLVHPLPILIPTYGHALRGKEIFSLALFINKLVGLDLTDVTAAQQRFPQCRTVSKQECLLLCPGINEQGLTGGVIVYDCQMSSSERLVLSFARSATQMGAELANYIEATALMTSGNRVSGIKARDILSGDELTIRARIVVNASGPWMDRVLAAVSGNGVRPRSSFSKAFNLLINRQLIAGHAIGIYSQTKFKDHDAIVNKGSRLYFIMPWHNHSLIGTAHLPYAGDPGDCEITKAEIQSFIDEINDAYPIAGLRLADVHRSYGGFLPVAESGGVQLLRHHQIQDHHKEHGIRGLISVSGVKFTEARYVAEKTVDAVFWKLGNRPPKSLTAVTPVYGAQTEQAQKVLDDEGPIQLRHLAADTVRILISHYGSGHDAVLKYLEPDQTGTESPCLIKAEVLHAIREEMAQKLADVAFRRTTLAIPGHLTMATLGFSAAVMAKELHWNDQRLGRELEETRKCLPMDTWIGEAA